VRAPALTSCAAVALVLGSPGPALASSAVIVQGMAAASGLELDGQGSASTHIVKVGELSLSTDASAGFTASITSGSLARPGATPISFQVVLVDRNAAAPSSGAFTTPSGTACLFTTTSAGTVDKDIYIKYLPASWQDPGVYAASIDIAIVEN